jgi:hypothetical protein
MRACFLGQNVTALGFGVAMLQTPPLPEPPEEKTPAAKEAEPAASKAPEAPKETA